MASMATLAVAEIEVPVGFYSIDGSGPEPHPEIGSAERRRGFIEETTMSMNLVILIVVLFLLFGGGGGYYYSRRSRG